MPDRVRRRTRKTARPSAQPIRPADERSARIYALMSEAEALHKGGHHRDAIAACRALAKLDPTNAMPEQMIEGCQREIRTRRALWLGAIAALALAAIGIAVIYPYITHIRAEPSPGALQLKERQTRLFRVESTLGYHKGLEYQWRLFDADGAPAPAAEAGTLAQQEGLPWSCAYTPPHDLVRGAAGGTSVTRRLRVSGRNASGREATSAEWVIEVADSPQPPRIVSRTPPPEGLLAIVAGAGERTFQVSAADGDGGTNLTYEWLVGDDLRHKGDEPAWTFRPPADALPQGMTGRELPSAPPLPVTCRVANRAGNPLPVTAQWDVRLVRSNAPPQLIAFEPELPSLVVLREGEARTVKVRPYDPDEGDILTLTYNWELDGRSLSRYKSCTLQFPHDTTDKEKAYALRLTVADLCGASVERSWRIVVMDAPKPAAP